MKRELTLIEIQEVGLDILKHFHEFCQSNNIRYSLAYGTLIGAVRHKGFIPWDDDVDVIMLRDDFDRFVELFQDNSRYRLFSANRRNMYGAIARLCEMERTIVKPIAPMFTKETGIWIDIFPMDIVSKDKVEFEKNMSDIVDIHTQILMKRWLMKGFGFHVTGVRSFLNWIRTSIKFRHNPFYYVDKHISLIKKCSFPSGEMMAQIGYPTYQMKDYASKSLFEDIISVSFEGNTFCAMKGYDQWLRGIYGDYMQLPPEEERHRDHSDIKSYWK